MNLTDIIRFLYGKCQSWKQYCKRAEINWWHQLGDFFSITYKWAVHMETCVSVCFVSMCRVGFYPQKAPVSLVCPWYCIFIICLYYSKSLMQQPWHHHFWCLFLWEDSVTLTVQLLICSATGCFLKHIMVQTMRRFCQHHIALFSSKSICTNMSTNNEYAFLVKCSGMVLG